jgi:PAS domain-containing protein
MPWELALKGTTVHDAPFIINSGDADIRVLVSASPLVSDGVVSGAVLVWRDVTEREVLLARLADERHRVEAILTSITDGFAVLDEYCVYRYANQSLAALWWTRRLKTSSGTTSGTYSRKRSVRSSTAPSPL